MALLFVFAATAVAVWGSKSAKFESKCETFMDGAFVRTISEDIMMLEKLVLPSGVDSLEQHVMYAPTVNTTTESRGWEEDRLENYVPDLIDAHCLRLLSVFLPRSDGLEGDMMAGLHGLGSLQNLHQNLTAGPRPTSKPELNEGFGVRISSTGHGHRTPPELLSKKTERQMARKKERRRKRRRERRAGQRLWNSTWDVSLTSSPTTFGIGPAWDCSTIGSSVDAAEFWLPLGMSVAKRSHGSLPGIRPLSESPLVQPCSGGFGEEFKQDGLVPHLTQSADRERRRRFDVLKARALKERRRNRGDRKTGRKTEEKGQRGRGGRRMKKDMKDMVQTEVIIQQPTQQ